MKLFIPSTVLTGALSFAKDHPKVANWFNALDNSKQACIKSINSEILTLSEDKKIIYVRIYVDYYAYNSELDKVEDMIIDISYDENRGYQLLNVRPSSQV